MVSRQCLVNILRCSSEVSYIALDTPGIICEICMWLRKLIPVTNFSCYRCNISAHLCGKPCLLASKRGCMERCSKVRRAMFFQSDVYSIIAKIIGHEGDEHLCPAPVHECSEVEHIIRDFSCASTNTSIAMQLGTYSHPRWPAVLVWRTMPNP